MTQGFKPIISSAESIIELFLNTFTAQSFEPRVGALRIIYSGESLLIAWTTLEKLQSTNLRFKRQQITNYKIQTNYANIE
jgi:hypothetical protein